MPAAVPPAPGPAGSPGPVPSYAAAAAAAPLPAAVDVAVVGSGFAGIGAAARLLQEGRQDFVVLERAGRLGGTWRDNSYPGCACDVPSSLYSYSFAPNPDWSRAFSRQPEIWAYLEQVAARTGVLPRLRTEAEVTGACWDDAARVWRVETVRGTLTARVLVLGTGPLSEPSVPALPGLGDYRGHVFHSARWDHGHDLTGRRVGVVGTGASAAQFVPRIAPVTGHLTVFQRTPPWVLPRRDRVRTPLESRLLARAPRLQQLARAGVYWGREVNLRMFRGNALLHGLVTRQALAHLERQVPDEGLRRRLTPSYALGCKRVLLSNDYYPALSRPDVSLVTSRIETFTRTGVRTADGTEHELDTVVFGTGFHVTDQPVADRVRGRGGRLLREVWDREGMSAYAGTTIAGFPNLFMLVGPNTGLGHSSIVFMIEAQLEYLLGALRTLDRSGAAALDVRPDAQAAYNADLQRQLAGTVWSTGGCRSWYLDARGRNTTLWPTHTFTFRRRLARFDAAAYDLLRDEPVAAGQ